MTNSNSANCVDKQEWAQAMDKAKDAAMSITEMTGHAACAVGEIASHALRDASRKADELAANAGVSIQELSETLGNQIPQSGVLGNASQAVTDAIKGSGEYLQDAKLSGMTEDVARLIRRNPIPAVLIAVGLGWFVGRNMRS